MNKYKEALKKEKELSIRLDNWFSKLLHEEKKGIYYNWLIKFGDYPHLEMRCPYCGKKP